MANQAGESQIPTSPERHNAGAYPPENLEWGTTIKKTDFIPGKHLGVTDAWSLDQYGPKGTRFHG